MIKLTANFTLLLLAVVAFGMRHTRHDDHAATLEDYPDHKHEHWGHHPREKHSSEEVGKPQAHTNHIQYVIRSQNVEINTPTSHRMQRNADRDVPGAVINFAHRHVDQRNASDVPRVERQW